MQQYTKWRVFKCQKGKLRGRWFAQNFSISDGFIYHREDFDSFDQAMNLVIDNIRWHVSHGR